MRRRLAGTPLASIRQAEEIHEIRLRQLGAPAFAFKAGDGLNGTFECRIVDTLLVFGSNGPIFSVAVSLLLGGRGGKERDETLEICSLNNARAAHGRKGKAADLGFQPHAISGLSSGKSVKLLPF